jgi:hypothetical protein
VKKFRIVSFIAILFSTASIGACLSSMTLTGVKQPPRPPGCDFLVLTAPPAGSYIELGTIDVRGGILAVRTTDELKQDVQSFVCEAGGDAVYGIANGAGAYIKAAILKSTGGPSEASTNATNGAAHGGCQFDTQCKGERVCTSGVCVDPPNK